MRPDTYNCKHCEGAVVIDIVQDTEKATLPTIEFCPFCGMSNFYSKELEINQKNFI